MVEVDVHVRHVDLLGPDGGHQQRDQRHDDQGHGGDQALDQPGCSGRLAQSVMVFPLQFPVEDQDVEDDGGWWEDEETGGTVAQSAAYERVKDCKNWQTQGGKQQGEDDTDGISWSGRLSPDQKNLNK